MRRLLSSFLIRSLYLATLALLSVLLTTDGAPYAYPFASRPDVQMFIRHMATAHDLSPAALTDLFNRVTPQPSLLHAMARPHEGRAWWQYRNDLVTPTRIDGGVAFWRSNATALQKAEEVYGVPPSIVVALIGIETIYGERAGNWRIMDALSTLAFDFPRRGVFFRHELEIFLTMTLKAGIDPMTIRGSSAGAYGLPQFMPTSTRRYGVDFDADGRIDLVGSAADSIGSIANFLSQHGWQRGAPVAVRISPPHPLPPWLEKPGTPGPWMNIHTGTTWQMGQTFMLQGENGPEYWAGLRNFQTITRYNHSCNYAMAVLMLSQAIDQAYQAAQAGSRAG